MPQFHPHDHVIDLLVGQRLYSSADAAVRELLQNAEDACDLQRIKDPGYEAHIVVRHSATNGLVEFSDDGIGMNEEAIDQSFSAVGAPKDSVSHIRELLAKVPTGRAQQIAQFGIGVLSCFGVADSIELYTKMDDEPGLACVIPRHRDPWVPLSAERVPETRGTRIVLHLVSDGPMLASSVHEAVSRYARHAPHVTVEDADSPAPAEAQIFGITCYSLWHHLLQGDPPACRAGVGGHS